VADEELLEEESNMNEIEFPIPKFLTGQEEEKITPAKRGTIVHLCMKNLDFAKDYELQDIKNMIQGLVEKEIITKKEADSVNPIQILEFTKSDVWEELKHAIEYHKEEPFYINVPANKVQDTESTENILAQGIIDLYFLDKDGKLVLLDYKTDFVKAGEENVLIERHTPQLLLYKYALENALEKKVDRIYIYSIALGKKVEI
jgi:ATP-dependent helicase/nuclease subunit A